MPFFIPAIFAMHYCAVYDRYGFTMAIHIELFGSPSHLS